MKRSEQFSKFGRRFSHDHAHDMVKEADEAAQHHPAGLLRARAGFFRDGCVTANFP